MFELLGNHTAYYMANINMINPTGEEAFQKLHLRNGYAKHPMSQVTFRKPLQIMPTFLANGTLPRRCPDAFSLRLAQLDFALDL